MEHLSDSEIIAHRDGQLNKIQSSLVQQHLENCPLCGKRLEAFQQRNQWLKSQFVSMGNIPSPGSLDVYRARLEEKLPHIKKEHNQMFGFLKRHRSLSVIASILLVLTISLAIPSVRAFAAQILALFRIQETVVLPVNIADLPENFAQAAERVFYLVEKDSKYTITGESVSVGTAERASQEAGFAVRLPDLPYPPTNITVEPQVDGTFSLNVSKAQAILAEIERNDILIPLEWDGANITFSIPRVVIAEYSGCGEAQGKQTCLMFFQVPSPTISAPENVDVRQVGEIFLQVSGMSAEQARAYSSQIDWLSTLIIPVPEPEARYESVVVDGVKGTLILSTLDNQEHALIWVKENIIYAMSAYGDPAMTIQAANSLK